MDPFFESPPPPLPGPRRPHPRAANARPADELPAHVPVELLLLQDEQSALWLSEVDVYTTGFGIKLSAMLRGDSLDDPSRRFTAVRMGLVWPDGTKVFDPRTGPAGAAGSPRLGSRHGYGATGEYSWEWWVAPLPPQGDLTVVVDWAERGFGEARASFDTADLLSASARVISITSAEPDASEA